MEENQLKILEERINNAISFIESMKSREKALVEEKQSLETKTAELEEAVEDRDLKIEALQENQLFLKNKIEAILDKLEALAGLEGYDDTTSEKTQSKRAYGDKSSDEQETVNAEEENEEETSRAIEQDTEEETRNTGEIIIEENLVDLRTDSAEQSDTTVDESPGLPDENKADARKDGKILGGKDSETENSLFNQDEDTKADNQSEGEDGKLSTDYNNPFIET